MNPKTTQWLKFAVLLLLLTLLPTPSTHGQAPGGGGRPGGGNAGSSGSTITRQYPSSGMIGDAYFSIDPESRRVLYIADEDTAKYVSQVLTNLDKPKPQVLIKVVFLLLTYNNASDIGVEGGWAKNIGSTTSANAANVFGLGGLASAATNLGFNSLGQPVSSFQPVTPITATGAGLYQVLGQDFQATLRAIAQAGKVSVLSRPSILARNNQPAQIFVGQVVPLVTGVSYAALTTTPIITYTYQQVGVLLNVTPFITTDGLVEMIVAPSISSVDPTLSQPITAGVSAPYLDTRSASTVVVTADSQTVVIGGLMENDKSTQETKIPLLGDIPLLGNLFKRKTISDAKTELIIFLTPHIVQAPSQLAALSGHETANSTATKSFSEQELNQFIDKLPTRSLPAATPPAQPAKPNAPFPHQSP
ncbi:MAG: hypothetical protein KGS61_06035 [Verrucomicrobia bacterium]|nr:hypothetical protein [Verrucomicrobiota bacterium]